MGNSAIECEAAAIVKGTELAASLHLQNAQVESDCLEVIQSIDDSTPRDWRITNFLHTFQKLKTNFDTIKWNWVSRVLILASLD